MDIFLQSAGRSSSSVLLKRLCTGVRKVLIDENDGADNTSLSRTATLCDAEGRTINLR